MPPGDSGIKAPPCNGMVPPGRGTVRNLDDGSARSMESLSFSGLLVDARHGSRVASFHVMLFVAEPLLKSAIACLISSVVFMTKGP
jgi:hypothetical protein